MNAAGAFAEYSPLPLRCVSIRSEAQSTKTYDFALPDGMRIAFDCGQFLNLLFHVDGVDYVRSYSISSSAARGDRVSITVKRVAGGRISNWLFDHLQLSDVVRSLGPSGNFTFGVRPAEPLLLLTAGSGITPAASMLRSLIDHCSDSDVVMLHFSASADEIIFRDEMGYWARHLSRARIIPVVTRPGLHSGWVGASGRLNEALLKGLVPDFDRRRIYCCGPAGFMKTSGDIVKAAGVSEDRFVTESFESAIEVDTPADPVLDGFVVGFAKSGREARIAGDTTILKAARSADVRIVTSCNKGMCGTCRVKLMSGSVEVKHNGGIKQREIDQGFILACCSHPTSDVVIDR